MFVLIALALVSCVVAQETAYCRVCMADGCVCGSAYCRMYCGSQEDISCYKFIGKIGYKSPTMGVRPYLTSFAQGSDVKIRCGPCDDADANKMVTLTMSRCDGDTCQAPFYKFTVEQGNDEPAPPEINSPYIRYDRDPLGLYALYSKPNAACDDAGRYRCECGGKPFYGDVVIDDCEMM